MTKDSTRLPISAIELELPCRIDVGTLVSTLAEESESNLIHFVISLEQEVQDENFSIKLLHGLLSKLKSEYDNNLFNLVSRQAERVFVEQETCDYAPEISWETNMSETMAACITLIEDSVSWRHFLT